MLCYKDRVFCNYESCAKFRNCNIAVTEKDIKSAGMEGLPLSYYVAAPDCYEMKGE